MAIKYPTRHADRRKEIAMIHMAANRLSMDTADKNPDSEYRSLMFTVTRQSSSSALDFSGRRRFLDALNNLLEARGLEKIGGKKPTRQLSDNPQSKKIRALWIEMHKLGIVNNPEESALCAFVKRETGVAALQWLKPAQASQVIERLKQWKLRAENKAENVTE